MRPIIWKLALAVAVGLGAGTFGGQAVIAGMAPPAISLPSYPIDRSDGGYYADAIDSAGASEAVDYRQIADACSDCSDFDLGYRFAAAKRLRSTADCMDYSWSYQRGCLAYLREG
jgi:hypothetical protein